MGLTKAHTSLDTYPLTLALRAWFEIIDSVNFVGVHAGWLRQLLDEGICLWWMSSAEWLTNGFDPEYGGHPLSHLEPMHVHSLAYMREQYSERSRHARPERRLHLELIPNGQLSYLEQGQDSWNYEVTPAPTADDPVLYSDPEVTFVGYLRRCLRWGGFPGWERLPFRPEKDLTALSLGLVPF